MKRVEIKRLTMLLIGVVMTGVISCREDEPSTLRQMLEDRMHAYEQQGFSGSVLVVRRGERLLQAGHGFSDKQRQIANTPETVYDFGSLTKQFTGAAILKAETLGLLTVEQKLTDFFADVPADKATITIHQLLTHSAGFADALGDDYDLIDRNEYRALAFASDLKFVPGSGYSYSNVGYSLLGIILEEVSGQTYESFLHAHVFNLAGLQATGYTLLQNISFQDRIAIGYDKGDADGKPTEKPWGEDGPGWHLRANGGMLTTVEELYRWIDALNEKKIFDENTLKKYLTPYVRENPESSYYSYGWVIDESPLGPVYWHDGGNGIFSAVACNFPDDETSIVIASNDSTVEAFDLVDGLIEIIAAF